NTVKILLFFWLAFNVVIYVYYGIINKSDPIENEPVIFIEKWSVKNGDNHNQTISSTLPQGIKSGEYIFFDTRKDVSVYINGELRKDFIEKRDVNIPGGASKRFIMSVPLTESDSGAEIVIERKTVLDYDRNIPEIFISTRAGGVSYLLKVNGVSVVLSFIVLIFSFVSFVVSIGLRIIMKQRIDMMYGALGIFTIAAWLITDSFLAQFIFGTNHINGFLSFMFCLIIPLGLAVYLFTIQRGRYKKTMSFVLLIAALNTIIWPILHFTGILPFYNIINLLNSVLVILAVSGIVILIVDALRGNTVSYHYTFIGFLGFLVGCLVELINIIFKLYFIRETVLIVMGLAFLLTFIVIQQVHDLRQISMEKQHAIDISEAKTRFLASMSHEIRTPINAILGMNEMILRENDNKEIEEYSRSIKSSGKMLLMLVNDVLDFTKIESGRLEIKEADFLMPEMLIDVISLISERADEKELLLKAEVIDEVPNEIISDEFRIRQILVNLMNNAVKYTDTGAITLKVGGDYTDEGYELRFTVEDTGKGIHKEEQEHLFEAFSRANEKENANIEGTGLGLAIVKSIVTSMNGEIGVESEYGVGSKFWVKLPVRYENKEPLDKDFMEHREEQGKTSEVSSFTAPNAVVLAVDDNQSNLTIVRLFLKQNGIIPDICSSGEKAIELCKKKKYDLLLLDHMMPEPNGIETLHTIRNSEDSLNRDTKAVVLTANAIAGSAQMYKKEGFDGYLTKPLDSKVLEETVKSMLPAEKIIEYRKVVENELSPVENSMNESGDSLKYKLKSIKGLNYDMALMHCGSEEDLLREIISDIVKDSPVCTQRMRNSLENKDIAAYGIDVHSIKSLMATIGLKDFSERAKKHEFAAKDNDTGFIYSDSNSFIKDYLELCEKLGEAVK
nr:response regulator [Lachnospiraceae bacterium]